MKTLLGIRSVTEKRSYGHRFDNFFVDFYLGGRYNIDVSLCNKEYVDVGLPLDLLLVLDLFAAWWQCRNLFSILYFL